jgi:hypothetical protein
MGIGLPTTLFYQFVNALIQIDASFSSKISCSESQSYCKLAARCTDFDDWSNYGFYVQLEGTADDEDCFECYTLVPLAALTVDNGAGKCYIQVTRLDSNDGEAQADNVVLGAMYMSVFQNHFEYTIGENP